MNLIYYIILLIAVSGNLADKHSTDVIDQTVNNPPNVKIEEPKKGSKLKLNSAVSYRVVVTDQEDGSTIFGEIPPNEVVVELSCWPSIKAAENYQQSIESSTEDPIGLAVIKQAGCFNCHSDKARLMGPSFEDLAQRYKPDGTTIHSLAKNVMGGSIGRWGDVQMPPNPELSESEAMQAIKYILKQGVNKKSRIYSGFEGAIQPIRPHDNTTCVYLLTTSYTDKGKDGIPGTSLRGQHSILLK